MAAACTATVSAGGVSTRAAASVGTAVTVGAGSVVGIRVGVRVRRPAIGPSGSAAARPTVGSGPRRRPAARALLDKQPGIPPIRAASLRVVTGGALQHEGIVAILRLHGAAAAVQPDQRGLMAPRGHEQRGGLRGARPGDGRQPIGKVSRTASTCGVCRRAAGGRQAGELVEDEAVGAVRRARAAIRT